MNKKLLSLSVALGLAATIAMPLAASATPAASTVVVRPSNTQGWSTADTRSNGHVDFVADATSPLPKGALSLKTDASPVATMDKAQYLHAASNVPIAQVTTLGYSTKQNSASFAQGDPSYQLLVCLNGVVGATCNGFTTFVYEPYNQSPAPTITPGTWQTWDVDQGRFWSSRDVTCTNGPISNNTIGAGGGGAPFYTLSDIATKCPDAVASGFGVNIGSNNPNYDTETDAVIFNTTTYDFEQDLTYPVSRADCKNDGWKTFTGETFKNEGQCIKYVNKHDHKVKGDVTYTAYSTVPRHAEFKMSTASQHGYFHYVDDQPKVKGQPQQHIKYTVKISAVKVEGNTAWFAGVVTDSNQPSGFVGNWLFAKVVDNHPDQIWGSFTTESAAKAGVAAKSNPADGPFNVTDGNLKVN
jgi:hypothetical protein